MARIKNFYETKTYFFLKYLIFFVLFFVSNKAGINGLIYPFIFGIYFGLIWCNQNVFLTSICFLLSGYLATFSYFNLIQNAIFVLIFLIIYGVHYKFKKPFRYLHILIYSCICNIPKVAMEICLNNANVYLIFIELLLGLLYAFAVMKFFEALCVRGICNRLTSLEVICAMVFIGSIFCGLMSFEFGDMHLIKFFGALLILISSYVGNISSTMLISASIGIGAFVFNNAPIYISVFALYGIVASILKTKNKYITVVGLLAIECLCGFYFDLYMGYSVLSIIPLLSSLLIFIIIPNKILDKYSNEFQHNLCSMTQQSVINRNREMLYYRLTELSDVFSEMSKVLSGMISGGIINGDARRMLLNEVKISNCKDCPNHGKCYRVLNDETLNALNQMVNTAFEKGKVNLLDVPTIFAGKCERLNALVTSINDLLEQYKNYAGLVNNIDASKVLLAEQLGGVSKIMHELSLEINKGVSFEKGKEKRIIDELTYNNIICSDALVFQDNSQILSTTLAVRKADSAKGAIAKIVGKICGHNMDVVEDISSTRAGWQILTLKSAPKYDVIFGISTRTKTGSVKSGDSYSVIKIKDGKYLFAICDGMGSGEKAEQTSSTAIGLLESFYKAGFDNEIVLSSVNKLLSLGKEEVFSALDLCVIDTRVGVGSFIKMGAPESFVKHKDTTDVVKIGALPLGIVQNAECKSKDVFFYSGDKIVMCSDGIVDGFKDVEMMRDYINNIPSSSPQNIADQIVQKVLIENNNVSRDDMTVIVAKIFER